MKSLVYKFITILVQSVLPYDNWPSMVITGVQPYMQVISYFLGLCPFMVFGVATHKLYGFTFNAHSIVVEELHKLSVYLLANYIHGFMQVYLSFKEMKT